MKWPRVLLALLLLVLAVAAVVVARHALGWRSDAERWEADAARVSAQLDSALATSRRLRARADSLAVLAGRARASADSAQRLATAREAAARRRLADLTARLAVEVPDTCAPFVAALDSVAREALQAAETWHAAYDESERALTLKEAENRTLRAENDTLRLAVDSAARVLTVRPRPRRIPDWLAVGPGVTAQGVAPVVVSVNVLPTVERIARAVGGWF